MDIAKIRKKAKEQGAEIQPAGDMSMPAGDATSALQAEAAAAVREETGEKEVSRDMPPEAREAVKPATPTENGMLPKEEDSLVELLTFGLGQEEFALRVAEVEEILRLQKITDVPTMPDYVVGITSLRGKIIPVIDLKIRLALQKSERACKGITHDVAESKKEARILIIEGPKGMIGAVIDKVIGVARISPDRIIEPPAHLTEAELKYIEGIVILDKRFISVVRANDTMDIEIG